ncbi:MAG: discoidin domain-containing protein [Microbacteriaceae bacterium]|nr:discoidin domain-containing protein [Microbacteriaceae bacterium]
MNVILGPAKLSEPFNCWTDGAFGITEIDGVVYAMPPVNASACEQFLFSGPDVNNLVPVTKVNGLTANVHTDRGRVYDKEGWWPFTLWEDPASGTWYSYMHSEDGSKCDTGGDGVGSDLRTIGVWSSTDEGANWDYEGVALSLDSERNFQAPANNCFSQAGWPKVGGPGDHDLVVGNDGYLYLVYNQFTYINPAGVPAGVATNRGNMAVARSAISDKGLPGTWYKYYNGEWTQPGQGGHETYVLSSANERQPKNEQRSIAWNTYLEKYVAVFASGDGVYLTYSADLVNWTQPEFLYQETPRSSTYGDSANFIAYVNLVGTGQGASGTSNEIGRTAWLFYVLGNQNYEVHRRLLTFDSQENLAAGKTVTSSGNFGFGSGQNLTDGDWGTDFHSDERSNTADSSGWVTVDLGQTKSFDEVRLAPSARWGHGFPTTFNVQVSSNAGGPWTTVHTEAAAEKPRDGATRALPVGSQSARYVRLEWSRLAGDAEPFVSFSFRLAELEVYNTGTSGASAPAEPTAPDATYSGSAQFSSTQGAGHWTYMYRAPLDPAETFAQWVPMTWNGTASQWQKAGSAALVSATTQHPDVGGNASARIWRAPADGVVQISGNVAKADTAGGDGVRVRIMANRSVVWPEGADWQSIAFDDSTGYSAAATVQVKSGDRIAFIVDAKETSAYDSTSWNPVVTYRNVVNGITSSAGFSSSQGTNAFTYESLVSGVPTPLTWNAGAGRWEKAGSAVVVGRDFMHPASGFDVSRTWTAGGNGVVSIDGWVQKGDVTQGGDGVTAAIYKNGSLIWPLSGTAAVVENNDAFGIRTAVSVAVTNGDEIRFVVGSRNNQDHDSTIWPVSITVH